MSVATNATSCFLINFSLSKIVKVIKSIHRSIEYAYDKINMIGASMKEILETSSRRVPF